MKKKKLEAQAKDIKARSYLEMKCAFEKFMKDCEMEWPCDFVKEVAMNQIDELTINIREAYGKFNLASIILENDEIDQIEIRERSFINVIISMCYAAEKERRFLLECMDQFLIHTYENH